MYGISSRVQPTRGLLQVEEFGERLTKLLAIKTKHVTKWSRESRAWTNPWSHLLPHGDNTQSVTCFCDTVDTSSGVQFSKLFHSALVSRICCCYLVVLGGKRTS
jgi:hypothetical protein